MKQLRATPLVTGNTVGTPLMLEAPLSFWGGVALHSGEIVDPHHPQHGSTLSGKIVILPGTKGSTAGPGALLELLNLGNGPKAVLLTRPDTVCLIASRMSQYSAVCDLPVFLLDEELPKSMKSITLRDGKVYYEI